MKSMERQLTSLDGLELDSPPMRLYLTEFMMFATSQFQTRLARIERARRQRADQLQLDQDEGE